VPLVLVPTSYPQLSFGDVAALGKVGLIICANHALVTQLRRNPVPYLLAIAMASNIGSTSTITGNPQNMIIGRSEAIADPIDSAVGRPARHAFLGAGAARFIFEPKREFQLNIPVLLEMRHGDRQERDSPLIRVIREDRAHQLLGGLGKDHGRGDWRVERNRASG
jgi:hypothetical protein